MAIIGQRHAIEFLEAEYLLLVITDACGPVRIGSRATGAGSAYAGTVEMIFLADALFTVPLLVQSASIDAHGA